MRPCLMTMREPTRIVQITRHSLEWHDRFFAHVATAFDGLDFRSWADAGGWTNRYDVLALVSGPDILSTVARTRMVLSLIDGGDAGARSAGFGLRSLREGLQLGAIATRRDRQRRGYGARLMRQVLAEADRANLPVLLFSSAEAMGFYPKFGFAPSRTSRFRARFACAPSTDLPPPRLDPRIAEDRRQLMLAVSASSSHRGGLSARPDGSIILWYLFNTPITAISLAGGEALVLAEEREDRLIIRDWLGRRPSDFRPEVSKLITRPVSSVEFGFVPPLSWMGEDMEETADFGEALFTRGLAPVAQPLCFPDMLHT